MARFSCLPYAFLLMIVMSFLMAVAIAGNVRLQDCPKACGYRCSATSHKKPCLFYCNKCCKKCLCVPSGTYGHKEECPCYNNWKTKEGKPKCP
ncbi:gibberellin-regulated protein 12-like [Macadamia integrifolia]|uniref:gibberellin-regulated protein 12-like n=1 Tax=Macadamia integrifolia TaxID=60698 RepID=UPI001C4FC0BC|nr:gibberellin-regulated protein 12-like [Macadamia integrifolia]